MGEDRGAVSTWGGMRAERVAGFLRAYLRSMRLYYAFVTGVTGWVGVSLYQALAPAPVKLTRVLLVLVVLFLSWGINQIFNDYLGLREDRVNAPWRPMVNGELAVRPALGLSVMLLIITLAISYLLNPWACLALLAGVGLNILYAFAKAWSLWGNLVFGLSIAMCAVYGFLALGPTPQPFFTHGRLALFLLIVLINAVMTYFTYFKDEAGDRLAGKRTFVVKYGIETARRAGLFFGLLPSLALFVALWNGWLLESPMRVSWAFAGCALAAALLQVRTAWLYYRAPGGKQAHHNMADNIRACVAGQIALIALLQAPLACVLLLISYPGIGWLFSRHPDAGKELMQE